MIHLISIFWIVFLKHIKIISSMIYRAKIKIKFIFFFFFEEKVVFQNFVQIWIFKWDIEDKNKCLNGVMNFINSNSKFPFVIYFHDMRVCFFFRKFYRICLPLITRRLFISYRFFIYSVNSFHRLWRINGYRYLSILMVWLSETLCIERNLRKSR